MICDMWRSEDSEPIVFPWENKEEVINASKPQPPTREAIEDARNWAKNIVDKFKKHGQE
jgi:hypothetical protein